jgi:hypothetical protein
MYVGHHPELSEYWNQVVSDGLDVSFYYRKKQFLRKF